MRKLLSLLLICSAAAHAEGDRGCTADLRTGVCNAKCGIAHVTGCTADQLKPLLQIWHMDCISKNFPEETDGRIRDCGKQLDQKIAEWKKAQRLKHRP